MVRHARNGSLIHARKVISLTGSDRRHQTVPDLLVHGFEIVDGVNGRAIPDPDSVFDSRRFEHKYRQPPKPGEIGCTLSHLRVMQSVAEDPSCADGQWVLVCEDDAELSPRFEKDIERVLARCATLDMVMLASVAAPADVRWRDPITVHTPISPMEPPIVSFGSKPLLRTVGYVRPEVMYGALLYAIRRPAARRLLSRIDGLPYFIADDWNEYASLGLRIGLVRPNMAGQVTGLHSQISEILNGELWRSSAYEPEPWRARLRIRTRLRRVGQTVAVGLADLRGRRR